jgi:hypothetical protein
MLLRMYKDQYLKARRELGYKPFAIGAEIFAGRRTLIRRKVEPPSRPPTRARVLATTITLAFT